MRTIRQRIGSFTSEQARDRFLAAYDVAMRSWPEPRTELNVETSFGTVHVFHHGPADGEGTPIVLLHGSAGNASNWYPQIAQLGEQHPVYAIDTIDDPGRSVQRRVVIGSEENAEWLHETLAGLGLGSAHVVGVSYGGWLGLCLAVHRPQRLASVTLLDPGGLEKVPFRFYANLLLGAFATLAPKRIRPWLARLLANHALVMPPEHLNPVMLAARTWRTNRPAARPFSDGELRSITVPVQLIIAGRSSLLCPKKALARAEALIPGVRAEIIPGAGHGLPLEQPELVNGRILDFIGA
ncbi:alpha/beta fold hydrolase [Micromonospora sp. NPDC052213]|uniref:alpha/beta fold hydrolase n=1 Tax=Micromonospora sp. NPDC052213 TaxID=3155812 RepID=UPI003420DCC9